MTDLYSYEPEVVWGDLDALGHVNNLAFLRYLQEARIRFFARFEGDWRAAGTSPVVVNTNINFRRELLYPAAIRVQLEPFIASEKRLVLKHAIVDREDPAILYADAEVTLVWISEHSRRSVALPAAMRAGITVAEE